MFKNYLSWWIGNFGVVPLFLFSALRFAPHDLDFAFLLFEVTAVLETIFPLLYQSTNSLKKFNSSKYLHGFCAFVKRLIRIPLLFFCSFLLLSFPLHASSEQREEMSLAIGEHRQFSPQEVKSFAVTNRQVLQPTFSSKKGLIIRGKAQGFSELIIWPVSGAKLVYSIHVQSKQRQLEQVKLMTLAQNLGLKYKAAADYSLMEGTINRFEDYQLLAGIKQKTTNLLLRVNYSIELKRQILEKVYLQFYDHYIDQVSCQFENEDLICRMPQGHPRFAEIKKNLEQSFWLKIDEIPVMPLGQNLKIKLKIIQIERADGRELDFGLSQLGASVSDVFNKGVTSLIENNKILLADHHASIETLAEPQILIQIDKVATIKLGNEIPFAQNSANGLTTHTQWKFAGLNIKILCQQLNDKIYLHYRTELSSATPTESGAISGNGQHSQVSLTLGQPIELFDLSLKTDGSNDDSIPLLGNIPILGHLFRSSTKKQVHKRIIALAEVTNHE